MNFLQTSGGKILLEHFVEIGTKNINAENNERTARQLMENFSKVHGADKVRIVAAKANQKLKFKFYKI